MMSSNRMRERFAILVLFGAISAVAGCAAVETAAETAAEDDELLPFEAETVCSGVACGNTRCGFGQKCVADCCRPMAKCGWFTGACPAGMYPYPPNTIDCPGVGGGTQLCLDVPPGDPMCSVRHCAYVPPAQCPGDGSSDVVITL